MDLLVSTLEKYIEEQNNKVIKKDSNSINLKYNDRDGHYMLITKRRCKILREKLDTMKELNVNGIKIQIKDLEFSDLPKSNNTKITCRDILKISNDVVNLKNMLANEIKDAFYKESNIIINKYKTFLINCSNTIKFLDFINSGALTAHICGYCKPNININISTNSFFEAEQLRHPIIECINTDIPYHPHNISLGNPNSILLFGVNSSGKSSLMKSIGLAVILAQIGYYVPAKSFIYYPYKNLFTRIRGNDDMYKGLSSFMLEMVELGAILKRNTNNTLVLADELAKGTEYKSSLIIISYMLETLEKSKTSFISASHLHSLCDLPCIKKLNNVKTMHIKVSFDETNNELIYDRQLSEGEGDHFYGLLVCKYFMKSDDFNTRTKIIEQEVEEQNIKKSNYNNNLFMIKCEICNNKKKLETHHIEPQRNCDKFKSIENPHIKKNESYNLVILCSKCHDAHDRGDINIIGWEETSNGRKLKYEK
jgi:DNA mismatch repair protein MutS